MCWNHISRFPVPLINSQAALPFLPHRLFLLLLMINWENIVITYLLIWISEPLPVILISLVLFPILFCFGFFLSLVSRSIEIDRRREFSSSTGFYLFLFFSHCAVYIFTFSRKEERQRRKRTLRKTTAAAVQIGKERAGEVKRENSPPANKYIQYS